MSTLAPPAPPTPLPRSVLGFVIATYALSLLACALTRDFGYYFDDKYHVESLRITFASGVPLPRFYSYPSFGYVISLFVALPALAAHGFSSEALAGELGEALARGLVPPPPLLLDARLVFAAVSNLALFWVALLAWRLSKSRLAACAAVLALGLSFEFHYHARQWAPDVPMAQFACLAVLWAERFASSRTRKHLCYSALAAGLAAGTKFPGALALASVGVAILTVEFRSSAAGERWTALARSTRSGLLALAVLLGVFVLTTPAVIFDFDSLHAGVAKELRHYQAEGMAGPHHPYDVQAGWEHLQRLTLYLSTQALSYRPILAAALFTLALFGLVWLVRRDWRSAAILLVLPCLYMPYFSYQRLLLVRNLEVLLPFLAIGFGLGMHALLAGAGARGLRRAAALAFALALLCNAQFLLHADATILGRRSINIGATIERWVDASDEPVFLAPTARALTASRTEAWLAAGKLVDDPARAKEALILPADFEKMVALPDLPIERVRANRPWIYRPLPEGPWEVNYSYYPTWRGDERALVIDADYYREFAGLP